MTDEWKRAGRQFVGVWLVAILLVVSALVVYETTVPNFIVGFDFHVFWNAARAIGHGNALYDPDGIARTSAIATRDLGVPASKTSWAVYPPAMYGVLVPFGYLPWTIAELIALPLLAATPFLALRVMGVRDWRCYAVLYSGVPLYTSALLGCVSGALMLAVALMWRGRNVVLAGSCAFVAKLFLWPLLLVEIARDRRRGLVLVATAAALVILPWALLGFVDITRYPKMLSDLSAAEGHDSFSSMGLAYALGLSPKLGEDVGIALGLAFTGLAIRAELRGSRDTAYTLGIVAALLASPIVWAHYLLLLMLPVAARYPRFNWVWFLTLLPWAGHVWGANGHIWAFIWTWPVWAIIVVAAVAPPGTSSAVSRALARRSLGPQLVRSSG
jgi:alpha-1,2-mannosyltransferase